MAESTGEAPVKFAWGSTTGQPREHAVLFSRLSKGNLGELTNTGVPLSQIPRSTHKFIFECGFDVPDHQTGANPAIGGDTARTLKRA
jgi:hypothetical protein